jgi:hypothetical protein
MIRKLGNGAGRKTISKPIHLLAQLVHVHGREAKDFNEPSISGDSTMKRKVAVVAVVSAP